MDDFFQGRTGRGVRVAVIDSGIYADHPHVRGVVGGVAILPDGSLSEDYVDRLGHGTAVAAAIREKAPDVELFAIKIFDRELRGHAAALVRAIDVALANGAHVINLSLGTSNREHAVTLAEAVERASTQGAIIVAAREHEGQTWWPGALPGVVPVLLDWECPRHEYRVARASDGSTAFRASGYPREIPGVSPERNLKGISFAVANMAGFVVRAFELGAHETRTVPLHTLLVEACAITDASTTA